MFRKLKEQERKGKGGDERGVMIEDTETRRDIETDTEGYNILQLISHYLNWKLGMLFSLLLLAIAKLAITSILDILVGKMKN